MKEKEWREFEKAVADFAAALDPAAKVQHDIRLPDKHHRGSRQRDVWIEATICRHFPVSVLVSCKRWKRKLHSGNIEAFDGELASSGARVGVLYSYSGFTKPAVEKAKALKIPCCRLYAGSGPEIPKVLSLTAYCCMPQIFVSLSSKPPSNCGLRTWKELFELPVRVANGKSKLLDEIVRAYHEAEKSSVQKVGSKAIFPKPFGTELTVPPQAPVIKSFRVTAFGRWKFYRARLEAFVVNGSYEFTSKDFKGQIATPAIDRFDSEPGPGWEFVEGTPKDRPGIVIILFKGNAREVLVETMAHKRLEYKSSNAGHRRQKLYESNNNSVSMD